MPHRGSRIALAGALTAILAMGALATPAHAAALPTPAPVEDRPATQVTAASLPTVQLDTGVVWDQAVVGTVVFAGGQFTQTRPAGAAAGQRLTPRSNLLAYDITTGNLLPFAPQVNGVVRTVEASPDGSRIYIGGSFSQVDGQSRSGLAAFDVTTGELCSDFAPRMGGTSVYTLAVTDSAVYVGGLFTQMNGVARRNLAAVDTTGTLTGWAPSANLQVDSMLALPDGRVIAAGRFGTVNNVTSPGTANLDGRTGAILPWALNKSVATGVTNGNSTSAGTMGLSTDGTYLYGAAWNFRSTQYGNAEGLWAADPKTGALVWMTGGRGDHYDVLAAGGVAYGVGHSHLAAPFGGWPEGDTPGGKHQNSISVTSEPKGSNTAGGWVSSAGKPAPALTQWYPKWIIGSFTGMSQAGWTVEGNDDYVVIGGEFLGVNGALQQGLVRFAKPGVASAKVGPRLAPGNTDTWENLTFTTLPGGARISIRPNYDRDDRTLTYELYRSGTSTPVDRTTFASDPWLRTSQTVTLKDFSAAPGTTYTYTVKAIDRDANSAKSAPVTGTTGTGSPPAASAYSDAVLADGPSLYWRLGGSPAVAGMDWIGSNDAVSGSGTADAQPGGILGDASTATRFDGTVNGRMSSSAKVDPATTFSTEVWFNTTTTTGGRLSGYSSHQTQTSSGYDRQVYLRNDGKLSFGVWTGTAKVITTTKAYNDGTWHHAVATIDATGMKLYLDGQLTATNTTVTAASDTGYPGYWRLGADNLAGWPSAPSASFKGNLDEFAVYPHALTPTQITTHYQTGRQG